MKILYPLSKETFCGKKSSCLYFLISSYVKINRLNAKKDLNKKGRKEQANNCLNYFEVLVFQRLEK
jgi:hypothetical protein